MGEKWLQKKCGYQRNEQQPITIAPYPGRERIEDHGGYLKVFAIQENVLTAEKDFKAIQMG